MAHRHRKTKATKPPRRAYRDKNGRCSAVNRGSAVPIADQAFFLTLSRAGRALGSNPAAVPPVIRRAARFRLK